MRPQHYDLVGLIGSRDLADRVERGRALGIRTIDDLRLDFHGSTVGDQPGDSSEVLVAQHDRRHGLGHVEGAVVEGTNLAEGAAGVVQSQRGALRDQEPIDLFVDLVGGEPAAFGRLRALIGKRRRRRVDRIEPVAGLVLVQAPGCWIEDDRDLLRPADEHRVPLDLVANGVEIGGE